MPMDSSWWIMMSAFSWDLWLAVMTVVTLQTSCLFVVRHLTKRKTEIFQRIHITSGGEAHARLDSDRLLRLCASLVLVTVHAAYCATVVSVTAVSKTSLPFTGIEGVQSAGYSVIVAPGTSTDEYFKAWSARATAPPPRHAAPALSTAQALSRLCRSPRACLLEQSYTVSCTPQPCAVLETPASVAAVQLGFFLNKGSPFTGIISYQIAKLTESGILKRLKSTTCNHDKPTDDQDFRSVDMSQVALIFVILDIVSIISLLIMLCERALFASTLKKTNHI